MERVSIVMRSGDGTTGGVLGVGCCQLLTSTPREAHLDRVELPIIWRAEVDRSNQALAFFQRHVQRGVQHDRLRGGRAFGRWYRKVLVASFGRSAHGKTAR